MDLLRHVCLLTLQLHPDVQKLNQIANGRSGACGPPSSSETVCPQNGICQVDPWCTNSRPFERKAPVDVTCTPAKGPAVFQPGQKSIRNVISITMALHWWQTLLSRSPVSEEQVALRVGPHKCKCVCQTNTCLLALHHLTLPAAVIQLVVICDSRHLRFCFGRPQTP